MSKQSVYVLMETYRWGESYLVGLFSTRARALGFARRERMEHFFVRKMTVHGKEK